MTMPKVYQTPVECKTSVSTPFMIFICREHFLFLVASSGWPRKVIPNVIVRIQCITFAMSKLIVNIADLDEKSRPGQDPFIIVILSVFKNTEKKIAL